MTWEDVDDILYDGTPDQIANVRCPECGGSLSYSYGRKTNNMEVKCTGCYTLLRSYGCPKVPNFAVEQLKT